MPYDPSVIEPRWQAYWEEHQTFLTREEPGRPKSYILDMFPYPSGSGLHVGHPEGYTATDIIARQRRMAGFNVLHPMGWDAFGLPAERAAIREGRHPAEITKANTDNFRRQIKRLGFSYDWTREIDTSSPDYYRFTQWIFLRLYEQGLAYRAEVPVNWCPALGTVLANEEVSPEGTYKETGDPVERRLMKQWMLRITAYAERLLEDLDELDWPDAVKKMQREWIGRSEGAEIQFRIRGTPELSFEVYTTRPDTLFGVTYVVLAPEHPMVSKITSAEHRVAVEDYVQAAGRRKERDRMAEQAKKTGVFTGAHAEHPLTGEALPVWIADYVVATYGTGAIMAVPAHDERDFAFASAFSLPMRQVVAASAEDPIQPLAAAWTQHGISVASGPYDGLPTAECQRRITAELEAKGLGRRRVQYALRDWLFSRQRYWGEPFPLVLRPDGTVVPLPDDALPVTLPEMADYKPTPDGRPPLARATDWVPTVDPSTGGPAERETNTMPQWAGSCWYYLRYIDPKNTERPFDPEKERYWMPVDLYIGGMEHAVLHLLYARFWHKVLFDIGVVSTKEPFKKLFNQGMILAYSYQDASGRYYHPEDVTERNGAYVSKDGSPLTSRVEKMSKSRLNVVNPDDVIARYGADALRLYEMFIGPLESSIPWQTNGIEGVYRFLKRSWRLFFEDETDALSSAIGDEAPDPNLERLLHRTVAKVTQDIDTLRFNTAISTLMELSNALLELPRRPRAALETFALLVSPFAPHFGEEAWRALGHPHSLAYHPWPSFDPRLLVDDDWELPVMVGGKVRGRVTVPRDLDAASIERLALALEPIQKLLAGAAPRRVVYVPGKMVNVVL